MELFWIVPVSALCALLFAWIFYKGMMIQEEGTDRMKEIAAYVREGAMAYLRRQYTVVGKVFIILVVLLSVLAFFGIQNPFVPVAFLTGGFFSGLCGYLGMRTATYASNRTAWAASKSLNKGLQVALRSGAVMGLVVVGFGLLDIALWFILLNKAIFTPEHMANGLHFLGLTFVNAGTDEHQKFIEITATMLTFGMGASTQALFARLGGGILTKGADVGGDLVGKVEAGIPEDDPRNPATIADNVGDNVGDCAGMAADLFETYAVTAVATMVLAAIFFASSPLLVNMMTLPLAIGGACIITSIIGTFFVKLGASQSIMGALYEGLIATGVLSLLGVAAVIHWLIGFGPLEGVKYTGMALFECGIVGLAVTGLIIWITEYYTGTDYRPVKSIAASSVTGHGTNVIQGLAISMEATALPAIVIIAGILITYSLAGLFGIAIATTTMLSLAGMIVALDAFGPVTDNAGGIAEMAGLPKEVRKSTDALDAVGNTTKAVTKGYAIGSAGLGALVLFAAYNEDLKFFIANAASYPYFQGVQLDFSLNNPYVVAGLLFGGLLPYLFGALGMTAVGRAASAIVEEVRRQFREKPGIMQGTDKPDYGRAVDLLTKAAIKEMVVPSLLPVLSPIVTYCM